MAKKGHHSSANTIYNLLNNRHSLISTILIGNNIANIFASSLATAILIDLVGSNGFIYASVLMSIIIIIFTEITPKQYALLYPEKIALGIAGVLRMIAFLLYPVLVFVEKISNLVIMILPKDSVPNDAKDMESEIKGNIDLYQSKGYCTQQQSDVIDNIFALHKEPLTSVMIPINKTIMINLNCNSAGIIQDMLHHTYDNFPVYENNRNNIVGIISLRDIFRLHVQNETIDHKQLMTLIRKVYFMPSNTSLLEQINWFKEHKQQMVVIVDKNKKPVGIVTLQDIVKDVLYQTPPQEKTAESQSNHITVQNDGSIVVPGHAKIANINLVCNSNLPEKMSTIAGFIIQQQQQQQNSDKKFVYGNLHISVIKSSSRGIQKVRIRPLSNKPSSD